MPVRRRIKRKYYKPAYNGYAWVFKPTRAIHVSEGPYKERLIALKKSNPLLAMIEAYHNFMPLFLTGGAIITKPLEYKEDER